MATITATAGSNGSRGAMTSAVKNMEAVRQRTVGAETTKPVIQNSPAMAAAYSSKGIKSLEAASSSSGSKYNKVV